MNYKAKKNLKIFDKKLERNKSEKRKCNYHNTKKNESILHNKNNSKISISRNETKLDQFIDTTQFLDQPVRPSYQTDPNGPTTQANLLRNTRN